MFEIKERLGKTGVSLPDIVDAASELAHLISDNPPDQREINRRIAHFLTDPNISSLLLAAILLEDELIAKRPGSEIADDPIWLLSDECIGIAIAEIIAGPAGKFAFTMYDQKKPGIIGILGPFLDDAIAGLAAGSVCETAIAPGV
ncbi:MAG: phosphatidylglycerophosphatase A [Methanospirillaceae archaeon]|nr:phosphatidylglycerophosphatase A [Methanospirillaceae archaeon]